MNSESDVKLNILFLVPYPPGIAPSQRFRFEQYLPFIEEKGWTYEVQSFIGPSTWRILYSPGHFFRKAAGVFSGFIRRWWKLLSIGSFDVVFIHRETAPLGLPLYSYVLTHWLKKKVIFDFDDAIWMENVSKGNSPFAFLKSHTNAIRLMKWSWKNSCGNHYLLEFAKQYNTSSFYLPTTIDTENTHNRVLRHSEGMPVIGWTGTHSTIHNLDHIYEVLLEVHREIPFHFLFISDAPPTFDFPGLEFRQWNKESEIDDLLEINIGLMPLADTEWSKGKCGLKILQYMALGIVPVVSHVGVNPHLVKDGEDGFCCRSREEWKIRLTSLLTDPKLLKTLSSRTRGHVEEEFSTRSQRAHFLRLFVA